MSGIGEDYGAVLCDVDNVIRRYDVSEVARAEEKAGVALGATATVAFAPGVIRPLLLGRITPVQWAEAIAAALTTAHPGTPPHTALALARALTDAPFAADPAVVALLRAVRERTTLVLVTNASVQLEDDLRALGLADLAHHVVSSARIGLVKPDPRIFRVAAETAGTTPPRCLFVDDTLANVEAARALGMTGVHYRRPEDLSAAFSTLHDSKRS